MQATIWILILWVGFAASHMVLSSLRLRGQLVDRLGANAFLGFYSLVSFAFFVPLVWVYFANKHSGPLLWSAPLAPETRWVFYGLAGVALTIAVAGLLQPSPASLAGGKPAVHGVLRITRHPLFMGVGLLGILHMIPNGFASDIAFFSGLPIFAIIGCRHQDQRKSATVAGYREFAAATPFLPFTKPGAMQGLRELGLARLSIGVVVTIVLRWFHPQLFG